MAIVKSENSKRAPSSSRVFHFNFLLRSALWGYTDTLRRTGECMATAGNRRQRDPESRWPVYV